MSKNEKTSKTVASRAAWVLGIGSVRMTRITEALATIGLEHLAADIDIFRVAAERVAASALTQANDKK